MAHLIRLSPRFARPILGVLLLSPSPCCTPDVSLGDYTGSDGDSDDGGSGAGSTGMETGSGTDTDCGEACSEDFAVAYLSAVNYASLEIFRRGEALCEGAQCPEQTEPLDGVPFEECTESEAALMSPLGVEEFCRFSAVWLESRLSVGFTVELERESFERTRPRLEDETAQEAYAWFPEVVSLVGPGTAYRGDVLAVGAGARNVQTSVVNEACIERLDAQGVPWSVDDLEVLCEGTWMDGGVLRPLRTRPQMEFWPNSGRTSRVTGNSCVSPGEGPDTCCTACEYALGPGVARYGVDGSQRRAIAQGTALSCDEGGDALVQCRDLVFDVARDDGLELTYEWEGSSGPWPLPLYDKLRETHPDDRPAGLVAPGLACAEDDSCAAGQRCYGVNAQGEACSAGEDCTQRTCQPAWFGRCEVAADGGGRCVDTRFDAQGTGACFVRGDTQDRLSTCDSDFNGIMTAAECCDPALGSPDDCDPHEQSGVEPIARFDRDTGLSPIAQCVCEEGQPDTCATVVQGWCEAPIGTGSEPGPDARAGQYAAPTVVAQGGVRWDEEQRHVDVNIANTGNMERAQVERCAWASFLIDERTASDGWVANESFTAELQEDHDLALCSGSSYRVDFAGPSSEHHVRSMAGNTLEGRSSFVFETAQMRVAPNSLFPTDNLQIGSCDDLSVRFSSRLDPGPRNLAKLEIRGGAPDGPLVAGGLGCSPTATPEEVAAGTIPCLSTSVEAFVGILHFEIDESIHGQVLQPGETYAVVLPGLDNIEQMADPERYAAAIHDACGMPLILEGSDAEWLVFTVDGACE
ncbi:MAG: hypothetical protein ACRBN8_28830 [Nannocystales bacterium]